MIFANKKEKKRSNIRLLLHHMDVEIVVKKNNTRETKN